MSTIKVHQGDKEVVDFPIYDTQSKKPIAVDDVTAATFVAVFGSTTITQTLGDGISTSVVQGTLTVTVTMPTTATDNVLQKKGNYQLRVTRGTVGPETVAEGNAEGIVKIEG